MALRRRASAVATEVDGIPEPFRTRLHPMWHDNDAIRRFCEQNGLDPEGWTGPLTAFMAVVEAYAVSKGWVTYYGSNPRPFPSWKDIAYAGVPMFDCAHTVHERHPSLGFPAMTDRDWEWIARAEEITLARDRDERS